MTAETRITPITRIRCDTPGCQAHAVVMGQSRPTREALAGQQGWACDEKSKQDFCPKCNTAATAAETPTLIVVK